MREREYLFSCRAKEKYFPPHRFYINIYVPKKGGRRDESESERLNEEEKLRCLA
jgi:hypothetical protein